LPLALAEAEVEYEEKTHTGDRRGVSRHGSADLAARIGLTAARLARRRWTS